ncbi:beta-galactosidase [Bifidobacterium simiiventris]|uniref:beta-galactosidase n=1 Tax=Bifidobacterium simiiventris TaxID=2834434 RepID=UPI001C55C58D|nr:beta-galactosidase [Bifidobacterium simiiventris]MBW3078518.1 beta-galactosidase [Bifidobacterium simiiventris]
MTEFTSSVTCDHNRIVIDGKPRVLLCASLFPFRVPRGQWQQRLQAVKRLGYHAIDVYIPWNFHETAPGVWNFAGNHDIEEFLRMTHAAGLYAMVRPGPYICSEWDGGAIPAWVATDPERGGGRTALRQNAPRFLDAVREWYGHILPIIARQQYGHGGPVIAVQADNELDFYSCRDPRGYIGALADMMRAAGIDVPIVACAGQGDIERAFGGANGVTPAVNLYADDNGVDMDAHIRYYRAAADRYDVPLIVTETNRWHRTLRRMVGAGARFVGPFLQVSGWDYDFSTSVNNWGHLESYMTHDYDFGGVIDPAGQEREDADDARRLSAIIAALGERLAAAEPAESQSVAFRETVGVRSCHAGQGECHVERSEAESRHLVDVDASNRAVAAVNTELGIGILDLAGGGQLLTLTNVSKHDLAVPTVSATARDRELSLPDVTVPVGAGMMIVRDLPVDDRLTLCATDGELIGLHTDTVQTDHSGEDSTNVAGSSEDDVQNDAACERTVIELSAPTMHAGQVWAAFAPGEDSAIAVSSQCGDVETHIEHDALFVSGTEGSVAFTICGGARAYRIVVSQPVKQYAPTSAPVTTVTEVETDDTQPAWSRIDPSANDGRALPMEDVGRYAGAMRYSAALDAADYGTVTGVVLRDAADTISVRYGDRDFHDIDTDDRNGRDSDTNDHDGREIFTPWQANGGGALYVPFVPDRFRAHLGDVVADSVVESGYDPTAAASHELSVTARIWGHSNFDDARLPSLRLTAKRGITGALAVNQTIDLGSGWLTVYDPDDPAEEQRLQHAGLVLGADPEPRGGLGGRTTDVWPHKLAYTRVLHVGDATVAALHVRRGEARLDVRLNGRTVGSITPLQPTLWLGEVHDGDELTVVVWRAWGENAGRMTLLAGREITGWTMAAQGLPELRAAADSACDDVRSVKLPLSVAPGEGVWLRVPRAALADAVCSMNTVVRFDGDGLQLTAFTDDLCLGRVVLGGLPGTMFGGGHGDLFLVPEESAGDLRLYAEATRDTAGTLNVITLGGPVDLD